jgi:hypothetical protein
LAQASKNLLLDGISEMDHDEKLKFLENLDRNYLWFNTPPNSDRGLDIEIAAADGVHAYFSFWASFPMEGPISIDEKQYAAISKAISDGSTDDFYEQEVKLVKAGGKLDTYYYYWDPELPDVSREFFEGWEKASEAYAEEAIEYLSDVHCEPWSGSDADYVSEWYDRIIKIQSGKQPW